MNLFAPPQAITAEVFAELPKKFRNKLISPERAASGRSIPAHGCVLEGPSFDRLTYSGPDRKTIFIVDSEAGCVLTARLPTAGRVMYAHR